MESESKIFVKPCVEGLKIIVIDKDLSKKGIPSLILVEQGQKNLPNELVRKVVNLKKILQMFDSIFEP